ncbi:PREDICTED: cytochrome P450 705A5-like [Camelina sativa]|uniref:Cytochrome P450 705A5-like n=1 Tax=Camelina sativa TaxID=90675 RepID=A0ABM0ZEH4_CAMSA|nr:PREDICTED: cytochrome P450 705A5-like [Camelina sativa]
MATMMIFDFQNCFIFIILCFVSLLCYTILFKKQESSRTGCVLPPSPPSLPIIGHLHLLLSSLTHKSLHNISSKFGPFLYLRVVNLPIVLVSSASVAYEIYKTQDVNVSSRVATSLGDSLFLGSSGFITAPYGDYWKFMKKMVATKLLRPQAIEQSRGGRAEELQGLYENLLDKAMKKESIEISKEAMKFTNNIICRMSMGRSCSDENGEAEIVRELLVKSTALTKKIFFANMFPRIPLFKKEIMGVSNQFDELLERLLVEHEERVEEHENKDMMDLLLEAFRDEHAEYKISRKQIKSLFVEIFLGGTDTSAQTVQWIMAELINKPSIIEKIREEIDSVVGKTRLIKETDLPKLPYLQVVVKEGLRMHPPSPLVVRTFQESCEVKGFYMPEKTMLVINVYALMRDPESWEDPNEFKPERFLPSSKSRQDEEKEQGLKYLPFGAGRRGCPGSNLAYLFVGLAVGVMVQCFDWKIKEDKVNMEETTAGMNLAMAHPFKCTPVVRIDPLTFNLKSPSP